MFFAQNAINNADLMTLKPLTSEIKIAKPQ